METRRALGSRYELVEEIGSGAMGEVWRTWDRGSQSWVAAKMLRSDLSRDRDIVARFVQERSILLGLEHPNILRVRDLVVEGDDLAIVMDLVGGPDLGRLLKERGTLAPRDAVAATCTVLDALAAAHERGCLHRDVKPDNVLLPDVEDLSTALLGDFGIARLAHESTVQATGLLGTPGYMPPELFARGSFSAASDVYAAGVLLYELLAGRTPFSGAGTGHTVGYRHVHSEPPRLPVPDELWDVLGSMLSKEPAGRLGAAATARELRALPADVLGVPALDRQPVPESWVDIGTRLRGDPAQVPVEADGLGPQDALASPGDVESRLGGAPVSGGLSGGASGGVSGGVSGGMAQRPSSSPPSQPPPGWAAASVGGGTGAGGSRRTLAVALAAAAVLVVVVGVVLATTLGGRESPTGTGASGLSGAEPLVATDTGTPLESGLQMTVAAQADPGDTVAPVDLTLQLDSAGTALGGDLLVVVPALSGGECPSVEWPAAYQPFLLDSGMETAAGIPCAWSLTPPEPIAAPTSVTGQVYLQRDDLAETDDLQQALAGWVAAVQDDTLAGVESIRSGYDFPAQRLAGIAVEVDDVERSGARTLVPWRVVAQWRGDRGRGDELLTSEDVQRPTAAALAVAGGDLDDVRLETCADATENPSPLDVVAKAPADSCDFEVVLGEFRASTTFRIFLTG